MVNLFEEAARGLPVTSLDHLNAIQATLEGAEIKFLNGTAPGVRLRPKKRK
jgi:hypothetical protein